MDKVDEPPQDWMKAWDAAQFAARLFGGLTRAQHALAIGLREGVLAAAAERSAISEGEDADFAKSKGTAEYLLGIPTEAWTRSANWESDRLRWDWELGDFEIENLDLACTYLFEGVHFLESEILALTPGEPIFSALPSSTFRETGVREAAGRRRGPKPAHAKWAALIKAVLDLERDGKLYTTYYAGPSLLLKDIQSLIEPELLLDDRTIDPVVSYIYDRLLCGTSPAN